MYGGEHGCLKGTVPYEVPDGLGIYDLRIVRVGELRLRGESVVVEPVEQESIHAQGPLDILGHVYVQVCEGGYDYPVAEVSHRYGKEFFPDILL